MFVFPTTYISAIPRQARWALFFSRFDFVISFRPGSKNLKADILVHSFLQEHLETLALSPIIPPEKIIASVMQDISDILLKVQSQAPPGKPTQLLFVPENLRAAVLLEYEDNKIAGHP